MDKQQIINLAIFEEFQKEDIEFAYPTQKIYLDRISNAKNKSEKLKYDTVN